MYRSTSSSTSVNTGALEIALLLAGFLPLRCTGFLPFRCAGMPSAGPRGE
ncbi:hypothetical protein [Streptomyces sp. 2A115]